MAAVSRSGGFAGYKVRLKQTHKIMSEKEENIIVIDGIEIRTDTVEYKKLREMFFHVCHKVNAVIGLNDQEKEWLRVMCAKVE